MTTELILLRHGQPELQNSLLGQTDSKLSDFGWQQMQASSLNLKDIDHVITSPLLRCKQFAVDYAIKNGIPFECLESFQECNFGDWDGLSYQQLNEEHSTDFERFLDSPNKVHPPNGETLSDFNTRIDKALELALEEHQGKKILLVSHGGVIRSLVAWCLKLDRLSNIPFRSFSIDYASQTHIELFHGESLPNEEQWHHAENVFPLLRNLNILPRGFS